MILIPLTHKQLASLPQDINTKRKPFRILCRGKSVNFGTGTTQGGNIIYHIVYWDRPKVFVDMVMNYLKENNPKETFRVVYSD